MLVLSRQRDQSIVIGEPPNEVIVTVVDFRNDKVRLGITAKRGVPVHRSEVYELVHPKERVTARGIEPKPESKPSAEHMRPGQETE